MSSRASLPAVTRRAAVVLSCVLFATSAAVGIAPRSAATATRMAVSRSTSASRKAVLRALGVGDIPAEIVILIDISESVANNNLYAAIRQDVPTFLRVLANKDPEDLVGVVLFGRPGDDRITDPGPPNPGIWLPPVPYSRETDFGHAFQLAVSMFRAPQAQNIKVGGVLLLSDGEVSMPFDDDPTYGTGFTAPGWKKLRTEVQGLPMTITGYDVPLTSNPAFVGNQYTALSQVFHPVQTLPYGTTDLSQALSMAKQNIVDSKVAVAAAPDSGQGVRVSWGGLRGIHGKPVDLAAGHADVMVTVTATTQHVPLHLSGLSVRSAGLPVTMKGILPGGRTLRPGQPATLRVPLTWAPRPSGMTMTGSSRTLRGTLQLAGTVSSTFTPTLRSVFGDTAFSVGGIRGGVSPLFMASEPAQWNISAWLLAFLGVVALLCAAIAFRLRMTGALVVKGVEQESGQEVRLRGRPRLSTRTDELIAEAGRMTVRGSLRHRGMWVRMRIGERPEFVEFLAPGKEIFPAGITVKHKCGNGRRFPWRRTRTG
jgi:hypothetical protein